MNQEEIEYKWEDLFLQTTNGLDLDPSFENYPIREKTLSFFYTFLYELSNETDVETLFPNISQLLNPFNKHGFKCIRNIFLNYFEVLLENGLQTGEIKSRAFFTSRYTELLWQSFQSVLFFWFKDKSDGREQTDLFVERVIHLVFDIYAPNAIDATFDLVQFLWKNRLAK